MTLPLRAGVRVTRFALNTTLTVSGRALSLAGGALQSLAGGHDEPQTPPPRRDAAPRAAAPSRAPTQTAPKRAPSTPGEARPEATVDPPPPPVTDTPPTVDEEPEPPHVSEEPELVVEVAEPGAEDGAGASVTVDEPWQGYDLLHANDLIDRLASADAAELAAIQLYESTHKRRETVLTAVERELRRESASARPD